ncbi:MAG: hypothetical protein Q9220_007304 [cf. Caloplaca sp. 1 TL-2023]
MIPARAIIVTAAVLPSAFAAYSLVDNYNATTWFSGFQFFDQKDPTNGFVTYKNLQTSAQKGLIAATDSSNNIPAVYLGVDSSTKDSTGRASIRVSSKKSYHHGLFVFDIEHAPYGCGVWPAAWLLDESQQWPQGGEIDIIEGVNDQTTNQITLHTTANCQIQSSGFSGKLNTSNCDIAAPGQDKNAGCAIQHPMPGGEGYGKGFNKVGGGVYATKWDSQDISVWHFPRADIPADLLTTAGSSSSPDPTKWGTPVAKFAGNCDIDAHFKNLNIIFNIAFCGDWAGKTFSSSSTCAAKAPSCEQYVQGNPEAFKDAYWLIRSVKVFQEPAMDKKKRDLGGWLKKTWHKIVADEKSKSTEDAFRFGSGLGR